MAQASAVGNRGLINRGRSLLARGYSAPMDVSPFLLLLTKAVRQDPYPLYERLLAEAPTSDGPKGMVVLASYADCDRFVRDPRLSSDYTNGTRFRELAASGALDAVRLAEASQRRLLFLDPPEHTRQLRLVKKAFVPQVVEGVRPRVRTIVDELLDRAASRGGDMEFVDDFAFALPMQIISDLLGVAPQDYSKVRSWSRTISFSNLTDVMEQVGAFNASDILPPEEHRALADAETGLATFLDELIADRRTNLGDDMLSRMISADHAGDRLSTAEIRTMCQLLLGAAGVETISNMIASGMLTLLRNPAELDRLRDDLTLVDTAVEEVLRHEPPVQFVQRFALEDLEVCGHTVHAGDTVTLLLAAANRDPERFADPQRFDVGRTDNPHLSFSAGMHFCIGARLARVVGQVVFARLAERLVGPRLNGDRHSYKPAMSLRALASLPIQFQDLKPA